MDSLLFMLSVVLIITCPSTHGLIVSYNRIIEWFRLEGTPEDHLIATPLPWAGAPLTRSGCSKPL